MYKRIVNLTFQSVFDNKEYLIKALLFPLLTLVLFRILQEEFPNINAIYFLPFLVFVNILIAVTTHRILLLGPQSVAKWGVQKFTSRELHFFGYSLLMGLICIPIVLLSFIPIVGLILTLILMLIVMSRISLVFPAISIDEHMTFQESWNFTKNYKLLMLFSVVLFPIVFSVLVSLVYYLVIGFLVGVISSKLYVLYPILDVFIMVFMISALSSTYKIIREDHPEFFEEQKEEEPSQITIINNNEELHYDKDKVSVDFETLKQELNLQYNPLGFIDVIINKENSWMLKNPKIKDAYIMLSKENYITFKIETFNTKEANLKFLELYHHH